MEVSYGLRTRLRPALGVDGKLVAPMRVFRSGDGWAWVCTLECWAVDCTGWFLPSQRRAQRLALSHLRVWHMPEPCEAVDRDACEQRHLWWPGRVDGVFAPSQPWVLSHPGSWKPLIPQQVTYAA